MSPVPEALNPNGSPQAGFTLRQVVHVSVGGRTARVRISNTFGRNELEISAAQMEVAVDGPASKVPGPVPLRFHGRSGIVVAPGAAVYSDPVELALPALSDVTITLQLEKVAGAITGHPASGSTSMWHSTAETGPEAWDKAERAERWYFLTGIEVVADAEPRAVVLLGDSITAGYGVKPGANLRWPDELARRLHANPSTADIGVLNHGIGGNRVTRDGIGPNIQSRFDRDVLAQAGVRWLVVLAGINDLGIRNTARRKGEPFASASDIEDAYEQVIERAHAAGLLVYGGTLLPFEGADFYWSADAEADRQSINRWIRESGRFDAVIDFDLALRDPLQPSRLAAAFDGGDHLHPSMAGYAEMARVVDLKLFSRR